MAISPINSVVANYSFTDGGDVTTLLDAMKASVAGQLSDRLKSASTTASINRHQLTAMLSLKDKLPALSVLADDKTVALGKDMTSSNELQATFDEAKLSLPVTQSYQMEIDTVDKDGHGFLTYKHLGTLDEMAAAQAAPLLLSAPSIGLELRGATDASGTTTTYKLYTNEGALVASKADIDTARTTIANTLPGLQSTVAAEATRTKTLANSVMTTLTGEGKRLVNPRKADNNREEARQADARKAIADSGTREVERTRNDLVNRRRAG